MRKSLASLLGVVGGVMALVFPLNAQLGGGPDVKFTVAPVSVGGGTASYGSPIWGDFDGDGYPDVFSGNHGAPPALLRNNGDGTFDNVVADSGIQYPGDFHGAAWGDYDNDGDLDLFITVGADRGLSVGLKKDHFYRNDGWTFTDVADPAGVTNTWGRGRSVNWVDYDRDGDLDLFVKNFQTPNALYRNNGDGTFTDVALQAGLANAPGMISGWADYDKDGHVDVLIVGAARDQLWRNNGNGTFTEVTEAAGLKRLFSDQGIVWGALNSFGQSIAWGDYNHDGYPDLYVARGYNDVTDSVSWNSKSIAFSDEEGVEEDGLDFTTSGTQVTFDLYLGRCRPNTGVYVGAGKTTPSSIPFTVSAAAAAGKPSYVPGQDRGYFIWKDAQGWHIRWSGNGGVTYFYGRLTSDGDFATVQPANFSRRTLPIKSTLYRNNRDGTFTDVTDEAGVGSTQNNRAAVWGDADNDGDLDLYVVNSGSFLGNGPKILYRNNGDGTFTDIADTAGVRANVDGRGDGAAWEDFDHDGFLDLYVTNGWGRTVLPRGPDRTCLVFGPDRLFRNEGNSNKWLKIRLVGTSRIYPGRSNRQGIGAKLTIQAGGRLQYREVNGGGGGHFFSQGAGLVHFGLGQADVVNSLTIEWPSGMVQRLWNLPPNRTIWLIER